MYGTVDLVSDEEDVSKLLTALPEESTYKIHVEDYAHLDYIWGVNAYQILYP